MQFSDNGGDGARRIARWILLGTAAVDDAAKKNKDLLSDP